MTAAKVLKRRTAAPGGFDEATLAAASLTDGTVGTGHIVLSVNPAIDLSSGTTSTGAEFDLLDGAMLLIKEIPGDESGLAMTYTYGAGGVAETPFLEVSSVGVVSMPQATHIGTAISSGVHVTDAGGSGYAQLEVGVAGDGGFCTITDNVDTLHTDILAENILLMSGMSGTRSLMLDPNGITATDSTKPFLFNTQNIVLPKSSALGIKVDTSAPTFPWRDMLGDIIPKTTGANTPTWSVLTGACHAYSFTTGDITDSLIHVLHDYVLGSDLFMHIHWCHNGTAISGAMLKTISATYAKGHQQAAFSTPIVTTIYLPTPNIATIPQLEHMITEVQLSTPGGFLASAVNVTITTGTANLASATALWTAGDVGKTVRITGAGAAGGNLDTTILTFTNSTHVVLANNAGTTVTAQPNYKQHMLDSNLIEPDGLIIAHYVMTTIPTITGGTVASPFVLFDDLHYQSTNIGTKQNKPNFYV